MGVKALVEVGIDVEIDGGRVGVEVEVGIDTVSQSVSRTNW